MKVEDFKILFVFFDYDRLNNFHIFLKGKKPAFKIETLLSTKENINSFDDSYDYIIIDESDDDQIIYKYNKKIVLDITMIEKYMEQFNKFLVNNNYYYTNHDMKYTIYYYQNDDLLKMLKMINKYYGSYEVVYSYDGIEYNIKTDKDLRMIINSYKKYKHIKKIEFICKNLELKYEKAKVLAFCLDYKYFDTFYGELEKRLNELSLATSEE